MLNLVINTVLVAIIVYLLYAINKLKARSRATDLELRGLLEQETKRREDAKQTVPDHKARARVPK
jgi:cell division protein FtsL